MHGWTQETSATVVRVSVARGTENSKLSPLNFWKNPREVIRRSQLKALSPLKPTLQGVHRQAEGHRLQHAAAEAWADGQSVTRRTTLFRREVLHHRFGLDVPCMDACATVKRSGSMVRQSTEVAAHTRFNKLCELAAHQDNPARRSLVILSLCG